MMRRFFRGLGLALLTLALVWGATGLYFKLTDTGPWPARADVEPSGAFEEEVSCYHGGGYDEFMANLRQRNGSWHPLGWAIALAIPRTMYEEAQSTVDCRFIAYPSDGYTISGFMLTPKVTSNQRMPVLIFNRGGNGGFGAINFALALHALVPYANDGFLVLVSQYRGLSDDDPAKYGTDEFGGAEVRDVQHLLELVDRIPQADPDNIFMVGASRGVMMNYLVARNSDRIRALASINGAADLELELKFRPEMERVYTARIPDYATRKHEALAERSVLHWADELPRAMPILLIHGGRDERVDPANGPRLKARLDEIGHPNKLITYPEDDHLLRQNRGAAHDEIVAWFLAHMRNITPAEATAPR